MESPIEQLSDDNNRNNGISNPLDDGWYYVENELHFIHKGLNISFTLIPNFITNDIRGHQRYRH